ncbi:polysaccharide biosynthesis tyrosine autokinase [Arthrobacter sp. KNU-44]|uniref:polysaccharide biosynthesis tyrosine autokinase n=1 Tax=unclassified Arthrobacter TaxID=235627 RepID=UPI003F43D9CB
MDIHEYLRILRRSWILIAAMTLLGLLAGGTATILIKPTYTSDTQLFVALQNSGSVQDLQQGNTFSQARVQSYVKTVTTPIVLQPAIDSLGLSMSVDDLAKTVRASTDLNTVLINISVTNESPAQAAAVAQAIANSLVKAVDSLEKPKTGASSPINLSIITPAKVPTEASAPNVRLTLILGFVIGLALGIGAAVLRSLLDNRIRVEADLRGLTNAPVLGGVTLDGDVTKKPLLTQIDPQSPRSESFRQLRTNLQFANVSGKASSVVVTSSIPGEGKTTTATNLAIALAQAGQTVCLVDADLRRPMVGEYLGLERSVGLTTALIGQADVNSLLQQWGTDQLYVLTSGQIPPNPSELLGSGEMKDLILRLESAFDTVIIDAPPVIPVTDAAVLSQHVGGVLVVVNTQLMKQQILLKSLTSLELVGANILGVVLNRLPAKGVDAYSYTYQGYASSNNEDVATSSRNRKKGTVESNVRIGDAQTIVSQETILFEDAIEYPAQRVPQTFPQRFRDRD